MSAQICLTGCCSGIPPASVSCSLKCKPSMVFPASVRSRRRTSRRSEMQSQDLTPIPIPPRQRWREFRIAYLPPLTFLLLVGVICWMWVNYVEPGGIIGEVETVHANIISTVAGTVRDLRVDQLQAVTNGEPLA